MAWISKISDLPETLALFPLSGALLLPHTNLPLRIFEPRYLAMVNDAIKTPERLIGLIQPDTPPTKDGDGESLRSIGCAGRITEFREDNRTHLWITLAGICRFSLKTQLASDSPYIKARVAWDMFAPDLSPPPTLENFDRAQFMKILKKYLDARKLATDWKELDTTDNTTLINILSVICPFSCESKQMLLEAPTLDARAEILQKLITFDAHIGHDEGTLQ